jgi:hypothetical protein
MSMLHQAGAALSPATGSDGYGFRIRRDDMLKARL